MALQSAGPPYGSCTVETRDVLMVLLHVQSPLSLMLRTRTGRGHRDQELLFCCSNNHIAKVSLPHPANQEDGPKCMALTEMRSEILRGKYW